MDHAARMGDVMQAKLADLADHPLVGNLRGVGLIAGLEFIADKASGARFDPAEKIAFQVQNACLEAGLVVRALPGDTCAICPPLIIDEDGIEELVTKLVAGLDAVQAKR